MTQPHRVFWHVLSGLFHESALFGCGEHEDDDVWLLNLNSVIFVLIISKMSLSTLTSA